MKHAGLDDNATQLRDPTVNEIEKGHYLHLIINLYKSVGEVIVIFSVSTVEPVIVEDTGEMYERRVIRVFNREGELDSVNEAVDGLEHNLSWKPQGSLIASTQRHIDKEEEENGEEQVLDLVFYERNGLRHGQFNTRLNPETETIESLTWSSDSEILLFQLHDRIQLWTTKNYHWYLKQELFAKDIIFAKFHPENH